MSTAIGAAWLEGAKPLGRHWLYLGLLGFLGFSGKVGSLREGTRSTGLPSAVAEVCDKAETWLKLRTGVTQAARSVAGAGCGKRGRGAAAGTGLSWAGPAVIILAQAGCAHLGSIRGNILPRQRLH